MFQLNLFGIMVLIVSLFLLLVVPSLILESVWNSMVASNIERDLTINLYQAALLWGVVMTLIYMSGIFSFKLSFKTLDSIDLDQVQDPELKEEIERLKLQAQKAEETKKTKEED